jgi:hypothetical protein
MITRRRVGADSFGFLAENQSRGGSWGNVGTFHFRRHTVVWLLLAVSLGSLPSRGLGSEPLVLSIDFSRTNGVFRPLHGLNKGPLAPGGLIDLTEQHQSLRVPSTRLHDCHWPNPEVVDIHAVFPDMNADPQRPESYDFRFTDQYIAAVRATGADVIYRLGESIEHTAIKRFVHPPNDTEKWAAVCLGIVRHYNDGWANGFRYNIRYWEIWNEPENRPAMWSGTDEDYFSLYRTTSRALKARFPDLKVGGPAVGASGSFQNGVFRSSAFVTNFLAFCRRENLPLDFFSWHCYTSRPVELAERANALRKLLDANGFAHTESHLNEWNFLPDNSWKALSPSTAPEARQLFYERMGGAPGSAFIVTSLLHLQSAPVDVCNFFHGELGGFGLFNEHGVPLKSFYAFRAFNVLMETPDRVEVVGPLGGSIACGAGLGRKGAEAGILLSNLNDPHAEFRLEIRNVPWHGDTICEIRRIDDAHSYQRERTDRKTGSQFDVPLVLRQPSVVMITLRPSAGP